ncbi:hypothetical protein NIES4102_41850 (plasmid) [Chondrocystis sp. NIES-4102]|nr:hypothetical protein NIES4102_41850 [Chondrocystis sp. NIES-4102]
MNKQSSIKEKFNKFDGTQRLINQYALYISMKMITEIENKNFTKRTNVNEIVKKLTIIKYKIIRQFRDNIINIIETIKNKFIRIGVLCNLEEIKKNYNKVVNEKIDETSIKLKLESKKIFQDSLSIDFQQANFKGFLMLIKNLAKVIFKQKKFFENKMDKLIKKENSILNALERIQCIQSIKPKQPIILNAFILHLKNKLDIDIYKIIIENSLYLIQFCQSYCNCTLSSINFLKSIKNCLATKCNDFNILCENHLLYYSSKIDINYQLRLLEKQLGCSLAFWGNNSLTAQQVESQLFNNIRDLVENLYLNK